MSDKTDGHHYHHKDHAKETKPEEHLGKEPAAPKAQVQGPEMQPEAELPTDLVKELKQQLESQSDQYLRLMAEFDNFKKRTSRDYERLIESANEKLISELIEVRENFERAVKAGEQCGQTKTFADGMKLIFTKFEDVLSKNGLKSFGGAGELFNPQFHDALMKIPNDTVPEDHIIEVFEKGYTLKKKVIKHAKVVVSSGAAVKGDSGKNPEETAEC